MDVLCHRHKTPVDRASGQHASVVCHVLRRLLITHGLVLLNHPDKVTKQTTQRFLPLPY